MANTSSSLHRRARVLEKFVEQGLISMFLKGCESLMAHSSEGLDDIVVDILQGTVLESSSTSSKPLFLCRRYVGEKVSLIYIKSNFSSKLKYKFENHIHIVFPVEKQIYVRIGSSEYCIGPRQAGYVLPIGQTVIEKHPNGCRSLMLRVCLQKLRSLATILLEEEIEEPITFNQPDPLNTVFNDYVRGLTINIARELNEIAPPFRAAFWDTFEADVTLRLLLHGQHSHTHLFRKRTTTGCRLQRVEKYIAEHWNKPVRLEDLAEVAGTSAKTVYNDFVRQYGETPHEFVKRLRLQNAQSMLRQQPPPSAMLVALRCGFTSFGHFARAYRIMFGELPSATSKRTRSQT